MYACFENREEETEDISSGVSMNTDDRAVLLAVDGYHKALHGAAEVREAVLTHTQAAHILRDMGNLIVRFHDGDPVPVEGKDSRESALPAYLALWDLNYWVLWEEPEYLFFEFMENILPAMMTDPTMESSSEVAGLFIILAGKAAEQLWGVVGELEEVGIHEGDLERMDEALIAFAANHGLSDTYTAS